MTIKEQLEQCRKMSVVSEKDFNDVYIDNYGVTYSNDGKRLLKGNDVKDYIVKEGTEVICNESFQDCFEVGDIVFPQSLRYIGAKVFTSCGSFTLPNGLLGIGEEAFLLAGYNDYLEIPDSVIFLGEGAFEGSTVLEVSIGKGLKRIEEGCFYSSLMRTVKISDSVNYIGDLAFGDNYIEEIVIPPSVKEVDGNPFGGWVKRIVSLSDNYVVKDNALYSKDGKDLIVCMSKEKELIIPDTVESIHSHAFLWSCVESLVLPDSINTIGEGAFSCSKIRTIHLPNGINSIPAFAFYKSEIQSITIPNTVKQIEGYAFQGCKKLKEVRMSDALLAIEEHAFAYCMDLETLKLPKDLKTIGEKAFFCCHELKKYEEELGVKII